MILFNLIMTTWFIPILFSLYLGLKMDAVWSIICINYVWFPFYSGVVLPYVLGYSLRVISGESESFLAKFYFISSWFFIFLLVAIAFVILDSYLYLAIFVSPYLLIFGAMMSILIDKYLPEVKVPFKFFSYLLIVVGFIFTFIPIKQPYIEKSLALISAIIGFVMGISGIKQT